MKIRIKKGDDPKKNAIPSDISEKFGNWTGSEDTKINSQDLMNRGLLGANQLVFENQSTSTADDIKNKNQSDWKIAAIQKILQKAYQKGIKDPTVFLQPENRDYLLSGVDPKIKAAINDPVFNQVHPNFWQVLGNSILPEQWKKFSINNNNVATK